MFIIIHKLYMCAVCRLRINHQKDVHCVFILRLQHGREQI
jgi:hypothetical protein